MAQVRPRWLEGCRGFFLSVRYESWAFLAGVSSFLSVRIGTINKRKIMNVFKAFLAAFAAENEREARLPAPGTISQDQHPKGAFGSFRGSRRATRNCARMWKAMAYDHYVERKPQIRSGVARYRTIQKVRLFFGTLVGRYLADRATMRVFWATAPR